MWITFHFWIVVHELGWFLPQLGGKIKEVLSTFYLNDDYNFCYNSKSKINKVKVKAKGGDGFDITMHT